MGVGGFAEPDNVIDCGNSGTGVRLIMGAMATCPITVTFTGDASLNKRPMARVTDPIALFGAQAVGRSGGRLPMTIVGAAEPTPVRYTVPMPSAQVKSAVLLAGLNVPGETVVIEKEATRDHTERMLAGFGAEISTVETEEGRVITLKGQPELKPQDITVPRDPSSAAFPVCAALITPGSDVLIPNIGLNPTRAGLFTTLREMGAEFADSYPKIASRLGMDQLEVMDPYVERLLEGSAFMAARVQLELEQQYPAFTQNLLEIVYPHFLAPTPSMMVARLQPDTAQGGLAEGFTLPRGTLMRGQVLEGEQTACRFTTAQDTTLWPLEITQAEYVDGRSELVAAGLGTGNQAKAALRLRLARSGGAPISALPLDRLTLFLSGTGAEPWRLYEAILGQGVALAGRSTDRRADWSVPLGRDIIPRGFDPEEALLPVPGQSFEGYRLLQEYFAMPQRFFFIDLCGLRPAVHRAEGNDLDLYILLAEGNPALKSITPASQSSRALPSATSSAMRSGPPSLPARGCSSSATVTSPTLRPPL